MDNNQVQLILYLLKHSTSGSAIQMQSIGPALGRSPASLDYALNELGASNFIQLNGSSVEITAVQRVSLAIQLLSGGTDPERVARVLRWQEFEDLVQHFLQMNGYETFKHVVTGHRKTRLELDLVAFRYPFIVCVDCKHWRRGLANSTLKKAAANQKIRTFRLSTNLSKGPLAMRLADWSCAYVVPVVVTLGDCRPRFVERVPVMSLIRFSSFLHELGPYSDVIEVIPIKLEA